MNFKELTAICGKLAKSCAGCPDSEEKASKFLHSLGKLNKYNSKTNAPNKQEFSPYVLIFSFHRGSGIIYKPERSIWAERVTSLFKNKGLLLAKISPQFLLLQTQKTVSFIP